jgi:ATP-dependent helicase/nuclease subunit A
MPTAHKLPIASAGQNQPEKWDFIGRQLQWRYPYEWSAGLAAKVSVTQVKGRLYPEEEGDATGAVWSQALYQPRLEGPRFLRQDETPSGAQRGALIHKVLARIKPSEAQNDIAERQKDGASADAAMNGYLTDLFCRLVNEQHILPAEADAVEKRQLIDLFCRAAAADARGGCRREESFTIALPPERIYPEIAGLPPAGRAPHPGPKPGAPTVAADETAAEFVMAQGTIDLFFFEDDGLVLADYKSDSVAAGQEDELVRRYKGQLRFYAEALKAFTGRQVKEIILYSLALGKEIHI